MKLGVVIDKLYPGKIGGAEQYIRNVLEKMAAYEDLQLFLFVNADAAETFDRRAARIILVPHDADAGIFYEYYIRKFQLEVLFCPLFYLPYYNCSIPMVPSVLDIQYEYFPENFHPELLRYRREETRKAIMHSALLLTISEFSKSTMIEKLGADADKVFVTYLNADASFDASLDEDKLRKIRADIAERYIFYPANGWPHKNHRRLLESFKILRETYHTRYRLVLTGNALNSTNQLQSYISELGLEDSVTVLGYVEQGDMPYIFKNADVLVFPSLFEGFGIPLVEAMRVGTPIACSGCGSIPEVAGDAAVIFDAEAPADIAEKLHGLETDRRLRAELIQKGYERAEMFSWDRCALETVQVLQKAVEETGTAGPQRFLRVSFIILYPGVGEDLQKTVESVRMQACPEVEYVILYTGVGPAPEISLQIESRPVVIEGKSSELFGKAADKITGDVAGIINAGDVLASESVLDEALLFLEANEDKDMVCCAMDTDAFYNTLFQSFGRQERFDCISRDRITASIPFFRGKCKECLKTMQFPVAGCYQAELLAGVGEKRTAELKGGFYGKSGGHAGRPEEKYLRRIKQKYTRQKIFMPSRLVNYSTVHRAGSEIKSLWNKEYKNTWQYYKQVRQKKLEFEGIGSDGWISRRFSTTLRLEAYAEDIHGRINNIALKKGLRLVFYMDHEAIYKMKMKGLGSVEFSCHLSKGVFPGEYELRIETDSTFSAFENNENDVRALSVIVEELYVGAQKVI